MPSGLARLAFLPNALIENKEKSFHETKKLGLDQGTAIKLAQAQVRGKRRIDLKDGVSSHCLTHSSSQKISFLFRW
jgi:hypothetical protein